MSRGLWILAAIVLVAACRDFSRFEATGAAPGGNGGSSDGGSGGIATNSGGTGGEQSIGGGGNGGAGASGGQITGCGKPNLLATDFGASFPSALFYEETNNGSVSIQIGDTLELESMAPGWGAVRSRYAYDLTDAHTTLEVIEAPAAGEKGLYFELSVLGEWLEFAIYQGNLEVNTYVSGSAQQLRKETFDASAHRFLRMRETDGAFFWEVSPNGSTWTIFAEASSSTLFDLRYMFTEIGLWDDDGDASAAVDNLNGGTPSGTHCASDTLVDPYDTQGTLPPPWANGFDEGCDAYSYDDTLHIEVPEGTDGVCFRASSRLYDARDSTTELEIYNVPPMGSEVRNVMLLYAPADVFVGVAFIDEMVHYASGDSSGVNAVSTGQSLTSGWVRLRLDGPNIHIEEAADGVQWAVVHTEALPAGFDASAVQAIVGGDTVTTTPFYVDTHFANFNLPP